MKLFKSALAITLGSLIYSANAEQSIIVGTEPTFAPFDFVEQNSTEIIGFDIDIINAVCAEVGLKARIEPMQFDGLIPSLKSKAIDAVISGVTITDERKKQVAFTEGYYVAAQDLMIRSEDFGKYKSMDDLKGKRVCVQIGTAGADIAAEIEGAKVITFNTMGEAFMELKHKGCDASITGTPVNQFYLASTGDRDLAHIPESAVNAKQLGIAVDKKNTELLEKLDTGLKKIKENGIYDKIYSKWFNK